MKHSQAVALILEATAAGGGTVPIHMTAAAVKRLQGGTNAVTTPRKRSPGNVVSRGATPEVRADFPRGLDLPLPPTLNHLFATVNGRRVKSAEGCAYADEAGKLARIMFPEPITVPVEVSIVIHPKRGVGMDLDNTAKCLLDSLKGIVWRDDKQVWRLVIERGAVVTGGRLIMVVKGFERCE